MMSQTATQRISEIIQELAWDPKPLMDTLVLMIAAGCAHTFGSKNVQKVIDAVCADARVPDWVEKMVSDSHVGDAVSIAI